MAVHDDIIAKSLELVQSLQQECIKHKIRICCAESCTGGKIAEYLTHTSGSSAVFDCGIVSYSNTAKRTLLNVSKDTLRTYGAVSYQTATEMATGILKQSNAHISIATTGITGPTGAIENKPVGTVFFAIGITINGTIKTYDYKHIFDGDRHTIQLHACYIALYLLQKHAPSLFKE